MKKILSRKLLGLFVMLPLTTRSLQEPYASIHLMPLDMHGWFSPENKKNLESFIHKLKPKKIIEVGTWLGASAIFMASILKNYNGKLYAVDTWEGSAEHQVSPDSKIRLDTLYQQFLSNCIHQNVTNLIIPIKMKSLDAAKALKIKSELIYIDAAHDEESVYNDIMHWFPKLVRGGIFCGDDWGWPSVRAAVERAALNLHVAIRTEGNFWYFEPNA